MEKCVDVKILLIHNVCDKCENGLMEPYGDTALMSNPPKYQHKCTNCGFTDFYTTRYPYQILVPINGVVRDFTDEEKKFF